jgi:RNA polymerase sigma-70 factor (ECF subfamily)
VRQPEDDTEVRQARAGDRTAFGVLVERYWGRIFRWLLGLTHRHQLAEDLTQEAFLRAWSGLPGFRAERGPFRVWLFAIAGNALRDHRRARRTVAGSDQLDSAPGREMEPAEWLLEREGEALLARACARLPLPFRSAFLLWSQERLSFAEIAQVLQIAEATARWRVFRARQLLVEALGTYLDPRPS